MRFPLVLIAVIVMFLSCKREVTDPKNVDPTLTDTLLATTVDSVFENGTLAGVDSTVYTYDQNGKLQSSAFKYRTSTNYTHIEFYYTRNSEGRAIRIAKKSFMLLNGVQWYRQDTLVAEITYDTHPIYMSHIYLYYTDLGRRNGDSIAYEYKGPLAVKTYHLSETDTAIYSNTDKLFFAGGDLVLYSNDIQLYQVQTDYETNFDDKVNPLQHGIEEFWWSGNEVVSIHNPVSRTIQLVADNKNIYYSWTYSYRKDGRPLRAEKANGKKEIILISHWFYR